VVEQSAGSGRADYDTASHPGISTAAGSRACHDPRQQRKRVYPTRGDVYDIVGGRPDAIKCATGMGGYDAKPDAVYTDDECADSSSGQQSVQYPGHGLGCCRGNADAGANHVLE
jgi:hypothetical protein